LDKINKIANKAFYGKMDKRMPYTAILKELGKNFDLEIPEISRKRIFRYYFIKIPAIF